MATRSRGGDRPVIREGALLTVEDAAIRLGIKPTTLRNWLSARSFPYVKVGRLTKIRPSAIDAYIERQTVAAIERE